MDATLAWMPTFVTEINALEANVNAKESATNADAIATAADAIATAGDRVQTGLDRTAAAASAASAAAIAGAFAGTSTTSLAIGSGSKTFTTQSGEQYSTGIWMTAVSAADPANYMFGEVTSYSGTTLIIDVQVTGGSGTHADWNLSLAGPRGAPGAPGTLSGNAAGGINELKGPDIASAATTMDIWAAAQGNVMTVTGTTATTGLPAAPQTGATRKLIAAGAWPLTHGANFILPGSANYTCAAGDIIEPTAITTTQFRLEITKADGTSVVASVPPSALITTNTLAENTSSAFTSISNAYPIFKIRIRDLVGSADFGLRLRVKQSGADRSTAADYQYFKQNTTPGSATATNINSTSATYIQLTDVDIDATKGGVDGWIEIYSPSNASIEKKITWDLSYYGGGNWNRHQGFAVFKGNLTAIDGVNIFPDSTQTMTGTMQLIGVTL
jgi:hypothetical protein